jgi:hypothetical protein
MGLGSGIRKKPIPDPGVKKAPDPGSGSATLAVRKFSFISKCNLKHNSHSSTNQSGGPIGCKDLAKDDAPNF